MNNVWERVRDGEREICVHWNDYIYMGRFVSEKCLSFREHLPDEAWDLLNEYCRTTAGLHDFATPDYTLGA